MLLLSSKKKKDLSFLQQKKEKELSIYCQYN